MLSTKLASLRDTPCASATDAAATTTRTASVAAIHPRLFDGHFIVAVTAVARIVQHFTGREQRVGALLLHGTVRLHGGGAHGVGHARPVAGVARAAIDLQQVRRLDQRKGVAADDLPLA